MNVIHNQKSSSKVTLLKDFLNGKSTYTIELFRHFIQQFNRVEKVTLHPANTMIGIATSRKRIAYITQLGKNFIHVVFPFEKPYRDTLCFHKISKVFGDDKQYNHHFRMLTFDDVNDEILKLMEIAHRLGSS